MTMSSPPLVVNKSAVVDDGHLFVHSNLMANNEASKAFDEASVIDVYSLTDGAYKFSFYIPDYQSHKASSFTYTIITSFLYSKTT